MYFGQKAVLDLNRRRVSLEKMHKALLKDLATYAGKPYPDSLYMKIAFLRNAQAMALIEGLEIARTITTHSQVVNLVSAMQALAAERRLHEAYARVGKTLDAIKLPAAAAATDAHGKTD